MPGRAHRGFTLLELMVVTVIFGVVLTAFLERLRFYQEMAEQAAMQATLSIIKTGLQIRLAELISTNRQAEAGELEAENPTHWLSKRPTNYAGEYREPPEPGSWYFDADRHQLVYVVNNGNVLQAGPAIQTKQLRFKVKLIMDRIEATGGAVYGVAGVALIPAYPYRWS